MNLATALRSFAHNLASTAHACLMIFRRHVPTISESLKYCEELGHKTSIGGGLNVAAALAVQAGEAEDRRAFRAADSIYDANAYKVEKADVDGLMIVTSIRQGMRSATKASRRHSPGTL